MDEQTRERLERLHRPHLFEDCRICSEKDVRKSTHVCDPVRKKTYWATHDPLPAEPNEEMVKLLEAKLLELFLRHRMVVDSKQLREFAVAMEIFTRGGMASAAEAGAE